MGVHSLLVGVVATFGQFAGVTSQATSAITADSTPIRKVITLIEEMKVQVEKEAADDKIAYDKLMCWCKTNDEAKTEAIANFEREMERLDSVLEQCAADESRLKNEIASLSQDIADDQDAVNTATATRQKEIAVFEAEEADLKETIALLNEAIAVLSKVQLLQKEGKATVADKSQAQVALVQLRNKISQGKPEFKGVMQRDLFEVLGSFEDILPQHGFLPRKSTALVESQGSLLPWEKYDEQIGMEAKPNDLEGAAANAKSYNSRSGRILGLLREMGDETARDLAEAQKENLRAEVAFQHLRAAKLAEIAVAEQQKKRKEKELADTLNLAAESKRDREKTEDARDADNTFLTNMGTDCKTEDEGYHKRFEVRSQELIALSETLRILTQDDARDLFGKTVQFIQLSGMKTSEQMAVQDRALESAMQKIAAVARKNQNWALVSLAVRVRLDAFTKVKEVMDKMLVELQKQQKEEYAKWEVCKSNIDKTEDDIKVNQETREDLEAKLKQLVGLIETLNREISELKDEEEQMKVSLKQAGELRKEQNQNFQTAVMDQRATTNILNKALARLKQFYLPKLLQTPGRAVYDRPDSGKDYAKAGNAGGVIQLIMKIIENSEVATQQLHQDEQRAQSLYAEFVSTTKATIEVDRQAIEEKSERLSETESARSDVEGELLSNGQVLEKLAELLKAHHLECDYLLKYFDIRQQARSEEMDAIVDAKAILSGSKFGK